MDQSQQYGTPPYGQQPPAPSYGYPPQQQHGVFPPAGQQSPAPGGYQGYQQPAYSQDTTRGYPAQGASIPATPQVPQGWLPLFEPTSQRWAFLDQNSGKVDWNYPTTASYPVVAHDATRGYDDQQTPAQGQGYYGAETYDDLKGEKKDKKDKKKDNSGMMIGAAAAGGLGVGVVGGVLLADALGKLACFRVSRDTEPQS